MIDRVVEILNCVGTSRGLTLAQIMDQTNLPRSSVYRILDHLVRINWIQREEKVYSLGLRMLELGTRAAHQHSLRVAAAPYLYELQSTTGLVAHLAVLDGTDVLYLEKIGGRLSLRVPSWVGGRAPAACTGLGKAMLAFADDNVLDNVLRGPMVALTSVSIRSERMLRVELDRIRERGVAFDREESVLGIGCVAAPVLTVGSGVAGISVCGPISQMKPERLVAAVRSAAHEISRAAENGPFHRTATDAFLGWPSARTPGVAHPVTRYALPACAGGGK